MSFRLMASYSSVSSLVKSPVSVADCGWVRNEAEIGLLGTVKEQVSNIAITVNRDRATLFISTPF